MSREVEVDGYRERMDKTPQQEVSSSAEDGDGLIENQNKPLPTPEDGSLSTTPKVVNEPQVTPIVRVKKSEQSGMTANYNQRNPAVRRLMKEYQELEASEETHDMHAAPLEDNLFEWHFTMRGPSDSVYSQGIYHGRIIFPSNYPLGPPEIAILTPNGRFETGTKICLSISNYHPETWVPSWGIRTAILALRAFMASESAGAIGSIVCSEAVRKQMANDSLNYKCPDCGPSADLLTTRGGGAPTSPSQNQKGSSSDSTSTGDIVFTVKVKVLIIFLSIYIIFARWPFST